MKKRRGRRRAAQNNQAMFEQKPFKQPIMPYPLMPAVSADELEMIHQASMDVLENIGIEFIHDGAKELLRKAGVKVSPSSNLVRLDRHFVEEFIKKAPSAFTVHARNPAHNIRFEQGVMAFAQAASPPNVTDAIKGRRIGSQHDFRQLVRLAQHFNIIHLTCGYPVEPVDIPPSIRHLECGYDLATLTDKVFHVYSLGKERNLDGLEIARLARGISHQQMEEETSLLSIINTNSPLRLDTVMLEGIIQMASHNQCVVITPFTLAGAMAPVTIAGALVQQNAEALAAIAFSQLVRSGAPVIYGGFTSNVDMKSGAPAFGTPEYMKATIVGGQLARKYNIPYRSSNVCAANSADAQGAWETGFSLWALTMGGANLVMHAAGWLEGGLSMGYEKMIIDVDMLQMVAEFLDPLTVNQNTLAVDAIADVGPGGHFFGTPHTQARYRNAFYNPIVSDWRNFESWHEAGSPTAIQKANQLWQDILTQTETPPMDEANKEELYDFVQRRKSEGGVKTDF